MRLFEFLFPSASIEESRNKFDAICRWQDACDRLRVKHDPKLFDTVRWFRVNGYDIPTIWCGWKWLRGLIQANREYQLAYERLMGTTSTTFDGLDDHLIMTYTGIPMLENRALPEWTVKITGFKRGVILTRMIEYPENFDFTLKQENIK